MFPETPIRDVVDRCRVWESHADPAVRRVSKPSPDPIYPAYVVGNSDNISETTRVAAVTRLKSGPDQLEDLLRRLLTAVDTPAPMPEVPVVEKLLQCLVAETQSRPPPVVSHPVSMGLEMMLRSFLSGQQQQRPRQRPVRWGGGAMVSGNVRPQDPGGGAVSIVPPRRMKNNNVSDTLELSGGTTVGPLQSFSGVGRRDHCCGHSRTGEDHEMSPLADTKKPSSETVLDEDSRSPCVGGGGGQSPLPLLPGGSFRLMLQMHQRYLLRDLVRVDGTIAEDTPGRECPREDRDWRPRAGVTRPAGVSVGGGGAGSQRGGGTLPSLDVAGSLLPVVPAVNPAGLLAQMAQLLQVAPMARGRR